jgi:uncharacterized protein
LEFEWDEEKRQSNLNKHGVDLIEAGQIFAGYTVEFADNRYNYSEDRFIAIGQSKGQILTVVYTVRDEVIRLISARKATKNETRIYYQGDS